MTIRWAWRALPLIFAAGCLDFCDRDPRPAEPSSCIGGRGHPEQADLPADCTDPYEPNGDLTLAAAPSSGRDCGQTERSGRISGDLDIDVYRTGECDLGTLPQRVAPRAELTAGPETLRLCVFPMCHHGATNVTACYQDTPGDGGGGDAGPVVTWMANSESGFRGCCRMGIGPVTASMDCARLSTLVDTFIWVDSGTESLDCADYTVRYDPQ